MFSFPRSVSEIHTLVGKANHLQAEVAALRNGEDILVPLCDSLLISDDPFRPTAMVVVPTSKKTKKNNGIEEPKVKKGPGKLSGYNIFMKKHIGKQRERVKEIGQDPASTAAKQEILRHIGAEWKKLDENSKQKYKMKAERVNIAEGRGGAKKAQAVHDESGEE